MSKLDLAIMRWLESEMFGKSGIYPNMDQPVIIKTPHGKWQVKGLSANIVGQDWVPTFTTKARHWPFGTA